MRILFCGRYLTAPIGGAEIATRVLMRELLDRNHTLAVFTIANDNYRERNWPFDGKIKIYEGTFSRWLHKKILPGELMNLFIELKMQQVLDRVSEEFQPDLVISQSNLLFPKHPNGKKTIFFVHDHGYGTTLGCSSLVRSLANKPFLRLRRNRLKDFSLVIANSYFMSKILKKFRINSEVVYPFIDFASYYLQEFNSESREYITIIRPTRQKGAEIFLQIADRLPKRKFLIVGQLPTDLKKEAESKQNVNLKTWEKDMREVYKETRLLLVPSLWQEPFGRAPVEAAINGIPSIASNKGGLIESVGQGGILIDDTWDIDKWVKAIELMDDNSIYVSYSQNARKNARKFTLKKSIDDFSNIVKEKLGILL
ncbi:glycosyltransferase family 4 protein [Candidatus Omnitrophota bacterium]